MATSKAKQQPVEITPPLKAAILRLISDSHVPLKPAELIKSAGLPKKVTGKALQASLAPEVESGQVFNWGTKTPLYWHRSRKAEGRERLLALSRTELLELPKLTARIMPGPPKLSKVWVAEAFEELAREELFRLVAPTGSKKKFVVNLKHPEPYLSPGIKLLLESVGKAQLFGPIMALIADQPVDETPAANEAPQSGVQEVAEKMFDAVNRIAFSPGTTVTFYRLRQQPELAGVPKQIFDQAALLLEHERKALLSLHDHAAALPPEEREQFVTDGLGTYYVSIYAR